MNSNSGNPDISSLLDTTLFSIGSTEVTGTLLLTAVLVIIASLLLSLWLKWWVIRVFKKQGSGDDQTTKAYGTAVQSLVLAIGVGVALHTIGVNMTSVFAAGGVFALGLSFAIKNTAENLMAGVMVRLERSIKTGDVIEVDGQMVKVTRLGGRSTTARTLQDEDLLIPNSKLVQTIVTSYTLRDPLYRLGVRIEVPGSADLDQVRAILEEAATEIEWRTADRGPEVFLESHNNTVATYAVAVWIDNPWTAPQRESDLNEALWKNLEKDRSWDR